MEAALFEAIIVMTASLFLVCVAMAGAVALPWTREERRETVAAFRVARLLLAQMIRGLTVPLVAPRAVSDAEPIRWKVPATTPTGAANWHRATVP